MIDRGHYLIDLGTRYFSWRDLRIIIEHLPPDRSSAFFRARNPQSYGYDLAVQATLQAVYQLQVANWQRSGDPDVPLPEPFHIPGLTPDPEPKRKALTAQEIREQNRKAFQEA